MCEPTGVYKVELHVHLDGAVRLETIWEIARQKGMNLGVETLADLYEVCYIKEPSTLEHFLSPFSRFMPVIIGDPVAIERIAYEFCEDAAKQNVLYCEVRYCPHLLSTLVSNDLTLPPLQPAEVVECVNRGLNQGSRDFHVMVKSILCCFRDHPEWSDEILDLCVMFKNRGVVGIDIAGDEAKKFAHPNDIIVFENAFKYNIHRTVHAGEAGPASNVKDAVVRMYSERIGHGYHVIDDPDLYEDMKSMKIHFEVCPYSSLKTGSVPGDCTKHPIVQFAEDNMSFSINRDDPTLIQKSLDEEYEYVRELGLSETHIMRANLQAAVHSFLDGSYKQQLIAQLNDIYGLDDPEYENSLISMKN